MTFVIYFFLIGLIEETVSLIYLYFPFSNAIVMNHWKRGGAPPALTRDLQYLLNFTVNFFLLMSKSLYDNQ